MRTRWTARMAPLACAAVLIGCGGSDDRREEQAIQDRMATAQQEVTLVGCVQTGQLEMEYVLQNVRTDPAQGQPPAQEPQRPDARSGARSRPHMQPDDPGITPYSFVQLRAGASTDLRPYLGQEVRLRGIMTGTGRETIGTAGARGTHQAPSGDAAMTGAPDLSHAEKKRAEAGPIARETLATETVPTVLVRQITPTGQRCGDAQEK